MKCKRKGCDNDARAPGYCALHMTDKIDVPSSERVSVQGGR